MLDRLSIVARRDKELNGRKQTMTTEERGMLNFVQGWKLKRSRVRVLVSACRVMTKFEPGFILGRLRREASLRLPTLRSNNDLY